MGNIPFKLDFTVKPTNLNENVNSSDSNKAAKQTQQQTAQQAAKAASEYHSLRHARVKQRESNGIKLNCVQKWASGDYEEEFGHTGNYCSCRLYGPFVHCQQA